ncbi:MAG: hypothetical protein WCR19_00085 [Acholeplasmataceae bacterium]
MLSKRRVSILSAVIFVFLMSFAMYHQMYKHTDDYVISDFSQLMTTVDYEVTQVVRYDDQGSYYYLIDYKYLDEQNIYEKSTLVYIYNKKINYSTHFNYSDTENHQEIITKIKYLEINSDSTIIDPSEFND